MTSLSRHLQDYLELRRRLGFKLAKHGQVLPHFVRFAQRERAAYVTTDLALRWATQPTKSTTDWHAARMSMARKFAAYLSAYDARTEVPPYRLLPVYSHRRAPRFYRDEDVRRLIDATRQIMTRKRLAGATYSTLFGLLAVTGMRVGEAIGMDCKDVDLERNLLTLRRTKGNKSRLVPIHPSTGHELGEYEKLRNQVFPRPVSSGFFISERSTALDYSSTFQRFLKMARQIGLRGPKGTTGVRLHDLRHRFAIRTLEKWYSSDSNAEQRLPQLATYLGHGQVRDTYWYLSATPELLKLAIRRLQGRKGGRTA